MTDETRILTSEQALYLWGCIFVVVALIVYELMGND